MADAGILHGWLASDTRIHLQRDGEPREKDTRSVKQPQWGINPKQELSAEKSIYHSENAEKDNLLFHQEASRRQWPDDQTLADGVSK